MSVEEYLKQNIAASAIQRAKEFVASSQYKEIQEFVKSETYKIAQESLKIRDSLIHKDTLKQIKVLQEQIETYGFYQQYTEQVFQEAQESLHMVRNSVKKDDSH